tara:strand:+ start:12581 stop:13372 length:792 start_codon:yes stop_codon:yes gene_type:complete
MFGEDFDALRQTYLPATFLNDIGDLPVEMSVHLQADASDPVRESLGLNRMAKAPASRGFPHAIVGYADFSKPDVADILAAQAEISRVVGIRQTLHHRSGRPLDQEIWVRNFGLLRKHDFSFELQVYPRQLSEALRLVDRYDDIQFVLPHAGLPQDRTAEGIQQWQNAMCAFAKRENVVVKASGFGMMYRADYLKHTAAVIRDLLAIFGANRCLAGSNYPVDRLGASYADIWQSMFDGTSELSIDERDGFYFGTAARIYKLNEH